jgi:peptidoglycan hydrolase-like protein with peptidoglycan-binding domain
MNRQSQDPNAARQNQTTGSATQSNTTEQSNASIRSQAGVQVSSQQRTTIQRSVLSARNVPRVDRVSFSIHTGTVVPRNVRIVSVTTFPALIEVFRATATTAFIVEEEIVFVDRSHKIVDVVPIGGGACRQLVDKHDRGHDLSEPEIREVQTVLIRRGYLRGRVTGVFDTRTRTALITFQREEASRRTGASTRAPSPPSGWKAGQVKSRQLVVIDSQSSSTTGQSSSGAQKDEKRRPARPRLHRPEKRTPDKAVRAEGIEQRPADSDDSERPAEFGSQQVDHRSGQQREERPEQLEFIAAPGRERPERQTPAVSDRLQSRAPLRRGSFFAQPADSFVTSTGARPLKPSARAAAGVRSMMRPRTNGPRSLIRTVTLRPLRLLVTFTFVPNGSVRCAAVRPPG